LQQAQLAEVWGRYAGEIFEIWFDGGENNVALNALIGELQPQAIATDGTRNNNTARLVGAESGFAPYPVWSAAASPTANGAGAPDGAFFSPAEADT
jgi:hypothetical protein